MLRTPGPLHAALGALHFRPLGMVCATALIMVASAAANWHLAGEFPSVWCETTVVLVAYFVLEAHVSAAAERLWRVCP